MIKDMLSFFWYLLISSYLPPKTSTAGTWHPQPWPRRIKGTIAASSVAWAASDQWNFKNQGTRRVKHENSQQKPEGREVGKSLSWGFNCNMSICVAFDPKWFWRDIRSRLVIETPARCKSCDGLWLQSCEHDLLISPHLPPHKTLKNTCKDRLSSTKLLHPYSGLCLLDKSNLLTRPHLVDQDTGKGKLGKEITTWRFLSHKVKVNIVDTHDFFWAIVRLRDYWWMWGVLRV